MSLMRAAAPWILLASWVCFSGLLAWNHLRVRAARRRQGIPEERPSIRDPRSMHGLVLEGLGFLIAFLCARDPQQAAAWQVPASIGSAVLSVAILSAALNHLGMEWRIKAVVTDDHKLVTTGPYAYLRHPVFAALLSLLAATVLLLNDVLPAIAAITVCVVGTEIRIRAEDGLLKQRFGKMFMDYRSGVSAYIPFVR
jgi:protein-S-isoprenylcysteine O-methyltransferase Ste14